MMIYRLQCIRCGNLRLRIAEQIQREIEFRVDILPGGTVGDQHVVIKLPIECRWFVLETAFGMPVEKRGGTRMQDRGVRAVHDGGKGPGLHPSGAGHVKGVAKCSGQQISLFPPLNAVLILKIFSCSEK